MVTQVFGLDATGGIAVPSEVIDDTTPQLGGDMSLNGFDLLALAATGPSMLDEVATGINPVFIPRRNDETTGVGSGGIGNLSMIANGTEVFDMLSTTTVFNGQIALHGGVVNSWYLRNIGASATVPTLIHNRSNTTTGIGGVAGDVSLIVNGLEILRAQPTIIDLFQNMVADIAGGPAILNEAGSNINPTLIPNKLDLTDGIGGQGFGTLHLIVQGLPILDMTATVQRMAGTRWDGTAGSSFRLNNETSSGTNPTLSPRADSATGVGGIANTLALIVSSIETLRVDASSTARDTRLLIFDVDNGTLERVTVGDAGSGGAGFKLLRIPD